MLWIGTYIAPANITFGVYGKSNEPLDGAKLTGKCIVDLIQYVPRSEKCNNPR
jgi:hypothetical protein